MMKNNIKKYEIWLVNLEPIKGSEQSGIRPCIVIQNNLFFLNQNTTIVLPITGKKKKNGKFKVLINNYEEIGLTTKSTILTFQIRTVDKTRFIKKIGEIKDKKTKDHIKETLLMTLDIDDEFEY